MSEYVPQMFDYRQIAQSCGVSPRDLETLRQEAFSEFPGDEMMGELHVLRMLITIQDGRVRLEDLLAGIRASTTR